MNVPLLDLKAQHRTIKHEIEKAIAEVMESQHFILGPTVEKCEKAIAAYSQCQHAVGVSSGTDALLICLMAEGIGPGDEVIMPPYTFFATVGSVARIGAKPVFVDIDPVTYNLDPAQIEARITSRTRAIIPVHLYGQMADMDPIMELANRYKLIVIEDAAQAIGAEYQGRRAGSIGHYGCFSFFPSKNLGAAGDAGMVVTNDRARADKLALLRSHGSKPKYYHKIVGGNFRLDAIQAAVVLAKLPHLDAWTTGRQRNAALYSQLLRELKDLQVRESDTPNDWASGDLVLPKVVRSRHIFNQYVIRVSQRDKLKSTLESSGIGTEIYYPVPMHLQECFGYLNQSKGAFPQSESAALETLALPIYPELTGEQISYVARCVTDWCTSQNQASRSRLPTAAGKG